MMVFPIRTNRENIPKAMVKYATAIPLESVVDILADVTAPDTPINSVSLQNVELSVIEIHVVSRATEVPFSVEDAGRNAEYALANTLPVVNQDTALNYRWIDTRTPANQAIFRIQSGVCALFREFFMNRGFVEVHTPKLIAGSSEGGANIFKLNYFDQNACLAQSPQLYKQMTSACGGFDRVFEIGPVFRAEDSNTHRHLCEFTGLDFEMCIYEHYYEALDVMGEMFNYIFDGIYEKFAAELQTISVQYPFEPIKYLRPPLRIDYAEGIALLNAAGITEASVEEDLSTPHEKALGKIVKEKYGTDFYIMVSTAEITTTLSLRYFTISYLELNICIHLRTNIPWLPDPFTQCLVLIIQSFPTLMICSSEARKSSVVLSVSMITICYINKVHFVYWHVPSLLS